jgi:MFS family permease
MPVYISEVSPKESRGILSSLIGTYFVGGFLVALCGNIGFSMFLLGWRISTSIQALLGLLFSFGMMWMPHSPR